MIELKFMISLILLMLFILPLTVMWIVSFFLRGIADLLENIVKSAGEWFDKTLNN